MCLRDPAVLNIVCVSSFLPFSLQYLHKLFKRDHHKGQKYHERQISLYAEYDRPNLLPFLRESMHCPLEKVCIQFVFKHINGVHFLS